MNKNWACECVCFINGERERERADIRIKHRDRYTDGEGRDNKIVQ